MSRGVEKCAKSYLRGSVRTKSRHCIGAARATCGKGATRGRAAHSAGQGALPRSPCPERRQWVGALRFSRAAKKKIPPKLGGALAVEVLL